MKKRHLYVVLYGIPAFLAAAIISTLMLSAAAGVLWLFVLGDNSWPSFVNVALAIGFFLVFMAVWMALLSMAYAFGKKQEATTPQTRNTREITTSVGLTALLIFVIVAYQWHVNNQGAQTPEVLCAEYCHKKGFFGSGMPPRDSGLNICSCFDARGQEVAKTAI